jgi:hypothetical protein
MREKSKLCIEKTGIKGTVALIWVWEKNWKMPDICGDQLLSIPLGLAASSGGFFIFSQPREL